MLKPPAGGSRTEPRGSVYYSDLTMHSVLCLLCGLDPRYLVLYVASFDCATV